MVAMGLFPCSVAHSVALSATHIVALSVAHSVALSVALSVAHSVALSATHIVALSVAHSVALSATHIVALSVAHTVALSVTVSTEEGVGRKISQRGNFIEGDACLAIVRRTDRCIDALTGSVWQVKCFSLPTVPLYLIKYFAH